MPAMPRRSPVSRTADKAANSAAKPTLHANQATRKLATRPDGLDFRDQMYIPTLCEVPARRTLDEYRKAEVPILDQGQEGACTGFGLATVANYLLNTRRHDRDRTPVSPHMFYDMARRYDEWAGIDYEGSSCRGAIKGWFKHGVCAQQLWAGQQAQIGMLTDKIVTDAAKRTLGAYFRVNHKSLVAMHSAMSEVGVLYASATVHGGWSSVGSDGIIAYDPTPTGGHAFAIVGYDETGFWIQNSWGTGWGKEGFGHVSYQDWLENGSDVWVARLGAPTVYAAPQPGGSAAAGAVRSAGFQYNDIRPHVISIGNDGQLDEHGDIGTSADMVRHILREDFPRITQGWPTKRIVLYAHGGLTGQNSALQHVAEARKAMLEAQCYPLSFIWHSDYLTTLKDMLIDATRRRRPEGVLDDLKDFMLDRLDDALEPLARLASGRAEWTEMKENALDATVLPNGGARLVADELALLLQQDPSIEIHLVGHSAGSVFHAPLLQYLCTNGAVAGGPMRGQAGLGLRVRSCTLWAPACTVALFDSSYLPLLGAANSPIDRFAIYSLTDKYEQDDNCAQLYHKSLLYLVSNAFEDKYHNPLTDSDGEAILGMQKFIAGHAGLQQLFSSGRADWVLSPNANPPGSLGEAASGHHGDFDDDPGTRRSTLRRIMAQPHTTAAAAAAAPAQSFEFHRSANTKGKIRRQMDCLTKLPGTN
jgi:hypothetical protein